jgi:hypothetical protein
MKYFLVLQDSIPNHEYDEEEICQLSDFSDDDIKLILSLSVGQEHALMSEVADEYITVQRIS